MKIKVILLTLALGASTCLLTAQDSHQRPEGQRPPSHEGGPGAMRLLPPQALETLKLSESQVKQITALEAETRAKLEKILTPAQLEQLKTMRPAGRPGGDGQGHPGGPGNTGGGSRPPRPAAE